MPAVTHCPGISSASILLFTVASAPAVIVLSSGGIKTTSAFAATLDSCAGVQSAQQIAVSAISTIARSTPSAGTYFSWRTACPLERTTVSIGMMKTLIEISTWDCLVSEFRGLGGIVRHLIRHQRQVASPVSPVGLIVVDRCTGLALGVHSAPVAS